MAPAQKASERVESERSAKRSDRSKDCIFLINKSIMEENRTQRRKGSD